MPVPIKIEVFHGFEEIPSTTRYYEHFREMHWVSKNGFHKQRETVQEHFGMYKDFPSGEDLGEILIYKDLHKHNILYLDDQGEILTQLRITKL